MTDATAPPPPDVVGRLRAAGCVFAEDEARLIAAQATTTRELDALVARRVAGEPLEQVLGWAEFCGLRITMAPGVFVPRRRTAFLVQQAVAAVTTRAGTEARAPAARPPVVVDLCCGAGAVGAAVAAALGEIELHAADVDPAAVRCARLNLAGVGQVYQGDLFAALPPSLRGSVDVLVANAPYVPTDAIRLMPPEARLHEPAVALDGGPDGLDLHRRIAADAPLWLAPGGHLLIETSRRQAPQTAEAFERSGLAPRVATSEELGATVVVGTRFGSSSHP